MNTTKKLVIASNNPGKIKEFESIFAPRDISIVAQTSLGITEVEETGLSFVENAIIKARHAAKHSDLPALADDSGIEVDALNGEPGIYSARFAGPRAKAADNIQKLLNKLESTPDHLRTARFQCVLVYMRHSEDPSPIIAQASWEGKILEQAQGDEGFGYDPIFWVPERACSAAELTAADKNLLSHRAKALKKLMAQLSDLELK